MWEDGPEWFRALALKAGLADVGLAGPLPEGRALLMVWPSQDESPRGEPSYKCA